MIDTTDHGPVRELRLNHPPANALSPEVITALLRAVEGAQPQGVRALVLSGSPGMFSAGLDVPLLLTLDRAAMATVWRDFYSLLCAMASCPIPLCAAVGGHAPAGGTVLALFCDYRIAAEGNWKLGLNEVPVGLPLPPVILCALRHAVGARQAERLGVSGALVNSAEALRLGLVDEVVPQEKVVERAVEWCRGMLALPPDAMRITRAKARADLTSPFEKDLSHELESMINHWWSDETQTALRAMVERVKKKPS